MKGLLSFDKITWESTISDAVQELKYFWTPLEIAFLLINETY